jgi:hypothetical protein
VFAVCGFAPEPKFHEYVVGSDSSNCPPVLVANVVLVNKIVDPAQTLIVPAVADGIVVKVDVCPLTFPITPNNNPSPNKRLE